MSNNSLFRKDHRYTEVGEELMSVTSNVLAPIFREFLHLGYSPREISHIMQQVVVDLELEDMVSRKESEAKQ